MNLWIVSNFHFFWLSFYICICYMVYYFIEKMWCSSQILLGKVEFPNIFLTPFLSKLIWWTYRYFFFICSFSYLIKDNLLLLERQFVSGMFVELVWLWYYLWTKIFKSSKHDDMHIMQNITLELSIDFRNMSCALVTLSYCFYNIFEIYSFFSSYLIFLLCQIFI